MPSHALLHEFVRGEVVAAYGWRRRLWPRVVSEKMGISGRVQHAAAVGREAPPLPHDAVGTSLDDARGFPQFVLARGAGVRRHGHVVGEIHPC